MMDDDNDQREEIDLSPEEEEALEIAWERIEAKRRAESAPPAPDSGPVRPAGGRSGEPLGE